ncbi:TIR domain-containing protein [Methylobacterium sp. V23]|uniref:nSTAND1 domain-containing NTPase n=1 Tax=Methylobacterium sp. V23 TaxID=2044878 RepID=UPI0015E1739B|nr:TIR domain-containing protein [Methylobacterium sp. V23]
MRYDVFLSYSRRDRDMALTVRDRLKSDGVQVFFDEDSLTAGLSWMRKIERAIDESRSVAILLGPAGLGNTQQYEREYALLKATMEAGLRVVPVLLPGCAGLPPGFLQLRMWVDFRAYETLQEGADEFLKLIDAIRGGESGEQPEDVCPYLGLETFREEDENFFCGRNGEIRELEQKLKVYNFVSLVGPSGSGKSSLVQAGLVPRLRRQKPRKPWRVITLKPGPYPFQNLVAELNLSNVALNKGSNPASQQSASKLASVGNVDYDTAKAVSMLLGEDSSTRFNTLIHIDAWEELYGIQVYGESAANEKIRETERSIFIDFLLTASQTDLVKVVVTVRADAYATLLRHPRLSRLWPEQQVNLHPMSREGLREAITKPASEAGLAFESEALVEDILSDVLRETDGLPLLQVALKETWKGRVGSILARDAYVASGKVGGVLNKTAERVFSNLTDEEKSELPRLLLNMVGSSADGFETLVRAPLPTDPVRRSIIAKMSDENTRLLVVGVSSAPPSGELDAAVGSFKVVEIAHASLLRTWLRLRDWISASTDRLKLKAELLKRKEDWERSHRSADALITAGFQLESAKDLIGNPGHVSTEEIAEFIKVSSDYQKQREEEAFRAEALQHAQKVEAAAYDIIDAEGEMQDFVVDLRQRFCFDFALLQLIDRYDSTIATVAGTGLREDWIGIGKHYLHGNGVSPDIQAYIATTEPPVIEVISGNDRRFDKYIFRKFGHARMSRAFIPVILCDNQSAVMNLKWSSYSMSPNVEENVPGDFRTLFTVDATEYENFKRVHSGRVIGTIEVGYYNHAHRLITDEAVAVFRRAARRALGLHDVSLDAVLHTVAEVAVNMVGADAATVGMYLSPTSHAFAFGAHVGAAIPEGLSGATDAPARMAQKRQQAVIVPSSESMVDAGQFDAECRAISSNGFKTMIVVPVVAGGRRHGGDRLEADDWIAKRANGLLRVFFARSFETLGREVAWLEYLARRTSDAVRNMQYIIKINEDERQLSNLHKISVGLSRDYMKDGLLDEVAGSAANMFAADIVTVFEYQEADGDFSGNVGSSGQFRRPQYSIRCCDDESFAPRRLVSRGDNFYEGNVSGDVMLTQSLGREHSATDRFLGREGILAVAGVILRAADEVVGVMFINFRRTHIFEQKERDMIETLAATAAIAVKNRRVVARSIGRLKEVA